MKKTFYKILTMIMAVILLISCFSMAAFAEGATHTYELYQIFTGTVSVDGILSDAKWGVNGKRPDGDQGVMVSDTVLKEIKAVENATDSEKLAVITKYVDFSKPAYKGESEQPTKETSGNGYTYSGIEPGYYLIKDKDGTQTGVDSNYTLYVAKVSGSKLLFEPKGSIPMVTKKIDDNGLTLTNSASIGEEINYVITGSVSSRISDYATYYYKFTDTLSKGLTYKNDSLKVYLKNGDVKDDVTQYFYVGVGAYDESNGTTITVSIKDLKELLNVKDGGGSKYTLTGVSQIIVTYTATLNDKAVLNAPNTNEVNLTYSNNPNDSGTPSENPPETPPSEPQPDKPVGETVKATTETYTTALIVTKSNVNGDKLQGAIFALSGSGVKQVLVTELIFKKDDNGTYYKLKDGTYTETAPTPETQDNYEESSQKYSKEKAVTLKGDGQTETNVQGEVDENGLVTFTGLGEGDYTLTEIKAPSGYNKINPIDFTVTFDRNAKTFTSSYAALVYDKGDGQLHGTIINYPGSSLPHTGGIGTTIFYVTGALLAVGAVVLLVVKKRMKDDV